MTIEIGSRVQLLVDKVQEGRILAQTGSRGRVTRKQYGEWDFTVSFAYFELACNTHELLDLDETPSKKEQSTMIVWLNSVSEQSILKHVLGPVGYQLLTHEEIHYVVGVQITKSWMEHLTVDVQTGGELYGKKPQKLIRLQLGNDGIWHRKEDK